MKNIIIKALKYIVLAYLVIWVLFTTFTENQINSYIKSQFITSKSNYNKIFRLNNKTLDSLITKNPNTIFYFSSLYCGYCSRYLRSATNFDSIKQKKVVYIYSDNEVALKDISSLIEGNPNINKIYYLDDRYFKGMTHTKAWNVVKKYVPNYNGADNYFPFKLETNHTNKIMISN